MTTAVLSKFGFEYVLYDFKVTINTKPEAALTIRFAFFQIQNKTPVMQKGHPSDVPFGFSDKSNGS